MMNQSDNATRTEHDTLKPAMGNKAAQRTNDDPGSLSPVIGILFGLFAIIAVTITFASQHVPAASQNLVVGSFTQEQVARAAIATAMDQDPTTIEVVRMENDVIYTTDTREDIKTTWANRCKLEGSHAVLATATGPWQRDPYNDQITFATTNETLVITRRSADGALKTRDFSMRELNI